MQLRHYNIFLLFLIVTSSCGTNPVTGKRELRFVSEAQEIKLGKENYLSAQQSQAGQLLTNCMV